MAKSGWARNHSPLASQWELRVGGPSDKSPIHVTNPHYPTHAGRDARGPQIRAGPPHHCPMPARAPALPGHRTNPYWRGRGIGWPDEVDSNRSKSPLLIRREVSMDKTPADIPARLPDIAQLVSAARATGQVQVVRQVFDGLTVDVRVGTASPRRPRRKTGILGADDPLFQLDRLMPERSASEAVD